MASGRPRLAILRATQLVVLLLVGTATIPPDRAAPVAAAIGRGPWAPPVAGPVVHAFEPPPCPYCAGHRGIDYAVAPGAPVRAVGTGVVSFAGRIGPSSHVVVGHAGGLRTSLSFLASVTVRAGQVVALGEVVGLAGGTGSGHDGRVVHLGLRLGDRYLDPALLFRPPDLARAVHLAPIAAPLDRLQWR